MTKNLSTRAAGPAGAKAGRTTKSDDLIRPVQEAILRHAAGADLENLLSVRIVQLSELIARGASQVYEAQFGIKNTELRILILLGRERELAVNEIARRARVDKGWISRSLDVMVERDIVSRAPHASDSRVSLVSLTDKGRDLLMKITPIAIERNTRLLKGFDKAQVDALLDALFARAEEMLGEPHDEHG